MLEKTTVTEAIKDEMTKLLLKEADLRAEQAKAPSTLPLAEAAYEDAMEAARKANEPALFAARGVYGDIENACKIKLNAIEMRKRELAVEAKEAREK